MASPADFKNGLVLNIDGQLWQIIEFQHVKPGKGGAFVRLKLKSMTTSRVLEDTIKSEEKLEDLYMQEVNFEYLYKQGESYVFMDLVSFDQVEMAKASVEH